MITNEQRPGCVNTQGAEITANSTAGYSPNSAAAQRMRILTHRHEHGRLSTIEAREDLDVLRPAMRVLELRVQGHSILTLWPREETHCGRTHRVARYVLAPSTGGLAQ